MRKIAIVGANEQQNPLILKAQEMGFETHVFAWQNGEIGEKTASYFYPISAGDKEQILEKCRELKVEAIASIGSDMAALTVAYVSQHLGLPGNTFASTVCATNKLMSRELFAKCGIPQPKYIEISNIIPYDQIGQMKYPLIVKPSDRSGGRGLRKIENEKQLLRAVAKAREISFEQRVIVEEYIAGTVYSCECLSYKGEHRVLGFTRRTVREIDGKPCEALHEQPANLPGTIMAEMTERAQQVLDTIGLRNGASSIEFVLDDKGLVYILEVTPTMYGDFIGTHLIPACEGYDYTGMVIDIACGNKPEYMRASDSHRASVRFIYDKQDWLTHSQKVCCIASRMDDADVIPGQADGHRYGYCITSRPYPSFGGCMSFKLPQGDGQDPLMALPADSREMVNSEFTAFWYALRCIQPKRIHMPYYLSQQWERTAAELGVEICHYHIDKDFLPADLEIGEQDTVLLVNYHGMCMLALEKIAAGLKTCIIDQSMSFYSAPVLRSGVWNIYSYRKFFPVADGACLVSTELSDTSRLQLKQSVSYKRARMLLQSFELGEQAAYKEQMANEQELVTERAQMSRLTRYMLDSLHFEQDRQGRQRNYAILNDCLKKFQRLTKIPDMGAVSQFYPLLVDADIRASLINIKIYVPLMWRRFLTTEFDETNEKQFSQKLLCLPIDPRYSAEDMQYLADTISSLLS